MGEAAPRLAASYAIRFQHRSERESDGFRLNTLGQTGASVCSLTLASNIKSAA